MTEPEARSVGGGQLQIAGADYGLKYAQLPFVWFSGPETFDDAENFLRLAGLDAFSFFPDLQGLGLRHKARVESDIRFARRQDPQLFK